MKDLTMSFVGVLLLAVGIGLAFRWLYPFVDLTSELTGLFVFAALVLKLVVSKLWSLVRGREARADPEAGK